MPVISHKLINKIARANNREDEEAIHQLLCEAIRKATLAYYQRRLKPLTKAEKIHVNAIQKQVENLWN